MHRLTRALLLGLTLLAFTVAIVGATTGEARAADGTPCGDYWGVDLGASGCDTRALRTRVHVTGAIAIGAGALTATAFAIPRLVPDDQDAPNRRTVPTSGS